MTIASGSAAGDQGHREAGDCRRKALDLLARRPHFSRELARKLERRGYGRGEVAELCAALAGEGLLDDAAYAVELATGSLSRKGYGPQRMRAALREKGVGDGPIEDAVAVAFPHGEAESARRQAERWLERRPFDRARLSRFLDRKGYSAETIRGVLEDAAASGTSDAL